MLHRLCGPPSIPLSFNLAIVLPRRITYRVSYGTEFSTNPTPSDYRLLCGLPGYLILFDTHTFVPQRQLQYGKLPTQLVFFVISTHFTATQRIPPTSSALKNHSFNGNFPVEPKTFTADLWSRLRTL